MIIPLTFFSANLVLPSKAWTLEDDSDEEEDRTKVKHEVEEDEKEKTNGEPPIPEEKEKEDEDEVEVKKEEEEEEEDDGIDPLDAYMITVQEEVTKIKQSGKVSTQAPKEKFSSSQSGVVIMEGTAKKKDSSKDKGELIEQNQDGLEVFKSNVKFKVR